jgi:LuxR family maltose regulon positive regulatory protein
MNQRKGSGGSAAAGRREGAELPPVLTTKLHIPPARSNLVSRPRLLELLSRGLENGLILLSAPAGFGKTTLLSEWLGTNPSPAGWLSLDRGDNDPVRFWTYLIAALQTTGQELGELAQALLRTSPPPPMESVITVLINDLVSLGTCAVLVLDDYHAIDSPAIHSTLAFFVDHLPTGVHVVIATRVDPPLPLARLRALGTLLELRADKLRFTFEETTEFLNRRMTLGISASDARSLLARTEGWIVGLQMAALSLRGRSDASAFIQAASGSQRYILDYLVEEVLSVQPDNVQAFLLQTCVLERMCGPLCDALLTEQSRIHSSHLSGQTFIEYLDRANLFVIPLDGERKWYRYHHLFADLLRSTLLQFYGEEQVRGLHARAATWYEENGLPAEAIDHALSAHETERALRRPLEKSHRSVLTEPAFRE